MSKVLRILLAIVVDALVLFLPIVPLQTAPVIPNPVYRLTGVSLVGLVARYVTPLVGVSYRWQWYTWVVIAVLLAGAVAASVLLLRGSKR
jgi:hypothetical protein